ncbi:MAG: hypothetical protein AAGA32_21955 [Pseudomonadota bacterium]
MNTDIVTSLRRHEPAHLDVRALDILETTLGRERARDVLEESCFSLVDKLGLIEDALHRRNHRSATELAIDIAGISAQIGLDDFSLAARNLADCLRTGDQTAIAAVSARMMRLGEVSLLSLLQLTDDSHV